MILFDSLTLMEVQEEAPSSILHPNHPLHHLAWMLWLEQEHAAYEEYYSIPRQNEPEI